jgi:WS/DGAT/MGAT family acyltransferase
MHVGGVYLFAASPRAKRFDFAAFRDHMAAHLDVSRTFRQRLMRVPFNLDHPYWIADPDFDLDAHLSQRRLAQPGHWDDLMTLAEQLFSQPLNQERPLWEMTFVDGLNIASWQRGNAFVLIVKVHHAAADGLSGEEMIWSLLDPKPQPSKHHQAALWQPEKPPSRMKLLTATAGRTFKLPVTVAKVTGQMATGMMQVAKEKILYSTPLPSLPMTAPVTPFNGPVTTHHQLRAIVLPFHKIQAMRQIIAGATVNDVVLTLSAGALRRYLEARHALPKKPLVAAVPIAVRERDHWQEMGNRVSVMLVSLATDAEDTLTRFHQIHTNRLHAKRDYQMIGLDRLTELIPSTTTPLIGRLYTGLDLARRVRPFFNLFITNVPGPQQPLYLGNARLQYHLGTAPLLHGLGVILVITSYLDTLTISVRSCQESMPDPDVFIQHLQAAFAELLSLVPHQQTTDPTP